MLLILSARTVSEDIALHYGRLPPAFLPLGDRRLFAWQADGATGPVAMTIPEGFGIDPVDRAELTRLDIRLIPQPPGWSLTRAIAEALEALAPQGPLRLLYGDTLVRGGAAPPDSVAVKDTTANYPWAYVVDADGTLRFSSDPPSGLATRRVVCGDYTFADPALLARACREAEGAGGIVAALNAYHQARPLAPVDAENWFDFGHLPLYFQSKKEIMVARVFNRLAYENHLLVKQSDDTAKMRAEAHWFEALPEGLRLHAPRYLGRVERDHRAGYALEYLYHPLMGDLAAFGALPLPSWLEMLNAAFDFLGECHAIRPDPGAPEAAPAFAESFFADMIVSKTWDRLGRYAGETGLDLDAPARVNGHAFASVRAAAADAIARVRPTDAGDIRFWHGDLFFGNMFYDFTARRVMVIDPRGQTARGQPCLYGDWRYDLAKLAHSVIGQYDKIILGRARLTEHAPRDWVLDLPEQPHQARIEAIFLAEAEARHGMAAGELTALTALLFFSMLPLHHDRPDLQARLMANGLRLAARLEDLP